ncbi:hypothetical protein H9Q72_007500 [Fusarium xylarioides]|uniref:Uncharacterized protein n=1 Tax=Fusarium xylarioides TaxID=221167 RepID=A0A9P7IIS6_9HYPO|nr:hypothetical protein H9Q70_009391 [Fusarium xylarioides]KAG5764412.1 hypothetical protein H9Q72_007500 [Fusarium xylarioides]KAG5773097.1 hypothetical protein H9Q73_012241 [Fusarium xylarioides]KAG5808649.1 hypothetical protein H9Q71_006864 [Fusarium xylarioides]KAG5815197.1 hypothetical protein H9Q74_011811 [Fusarium xylarioides]
MALPQPPPPLIAVPQVPAGLAGHQIGIFPAYITNQTETLIVREKKASFSGDDFEVLHVNGLPILKVEGKVMSVSGRKMVSDMRCNHLFTIVKEHFHIHTTYAVEDPLGRKLVDVRSSLRLFGSKATATFNSINGSAEVLEMNGSWHGYSANIVDTISDNVIARISRRLSGRDFLFGKQTYALEVRPGVDMALMVAMCICFDERNNENRAG